MVAVNEPPPVYDKPDGSDGGHTSSGDADSKDKQDMVLRDIAMVLCCSGFLIAETARECDDRSGGCTDNMGWGVACGVICFLVSLGWIVMVRFLSKDNPDKYTGMPQKIVCGFLWGMYVGAAGALTFDAPYTATGNGYFFSWGGFMASSHALYLSIDFVYNMIHTGAHQVEVATIEKRMILGCLLASVIELIQTAVDCDQHSCTDKIKFGIAMSCIGIVTTLCCFFLYNTCLKFIPYVAFGLSVLEGIAAVVLTFKGGPYNITGNGYFSAWGSFAFAFGLTFLTSRHLVKEKWDAHTGGGQQEGEQPTGSAQPAAAQQSTGGEVPQIPAATNV